MQAVGITSDKTIPSRSLSATSSRNGFEADKGRLHGDGAWSPSDIQVFLDKVKAPSNNAVIHTCQACNIAFNTAEPDAGTVRTYSGAKCVLGN